MLLKVKYGQILLKKLNNINIFINLLLNGAEHTKIFVALFIVTNSGLIHLMCLLLKIHAHATKFVPLTHARNEKRPSANSCPALEPNLLCM